MSKVKISTSLTDYSAKIHAKFSQTTVQSTTVFYLHQTASAKGPSNIKQNIRA